MIYLRVVWNGRITIEWPGQWFSSVVLEIVSEWYPRLCASITSRLNRARMVANIVLLLTADCDIATGCDFVPALILVLS